MKGLLLTIAAALAAPASALAAGPTLTVREVPLHPARTLAAAAPRFNMVGLHWRGPGAVLYRTRSAAGRWSGWRRADGDNVDRGWHLGDLTWTGAADAIRYRREGRVTRLRAYFVWSPPEPLAARRRQLAGAPAIVPRLSWGADESIRKGTPQIAPTIRVAFVHHTAGSNAYTAAQSASIVRGIELYHVQGNGWNDIGYNFLVDKYGQVFEGRYGGVDRAVVGAHTLGFNTESVGIAVIGDYGSAGISAAAQRSLEQLLAWKLDLAHVDPLSLVSVISGGNTRFPAGVAVTLRAISGHRDAYYTDCPGAALYAQLPGIAKDVAALGGPKIYAPLAAGKVGGPVRFTAKLSAALPWTVTVVDSAGGQVAQGTGAGSAVDWTWDASLAPPDRYTWTIASSTARAATGTLGTAAAPALAIEQPSVAPSLLAPGGDPSDDTATVGYTLTAAATVTATLVDDAGAALSTLFSRPLAAGAQTFVFTPPPGLADGQYAIDLAAAAVGGATASAVVRLTVDGILDGFTVSPSVFSGAKGGAATIAFTLTRQPAALSLQVVQGGRTVADLSVPSPLPGPGPQAFTWNGTLADGTPAPDGTYTLVLAVTDDVTYFTRTATVTVDSTPPVLTAVSYRGLRFHVSEPAMLTLVVGARRYTRTLRHAATTLFWLRKHPLRYALLATDAAGNTATLRYPLR